MLRRSKRMNPDEPLEGTSPTKVQEAKALCRLLDGLPLALDQAGAYIEEIGCSLSDYLQRYQARRAHLLSRRGQQENKEHPASVNITGEPMHNTIGTKNDVKLRVICTRLLQPVEDISALKCSRNTGAEGQLLKNMNSNKELAAISHPYITLGTSSRRKNPAAGALVQAQTIS